MRPKYFLLGPTKNFSHQNEKKTEVRKLSCLMNENTHVHLHIGLHPQIALLYFFFSFLLDVASSSSSVFFLGHYLFFNFFLFFYFDLLGRLCPLYIAHIYIYIYIIFLLLSFVCFFFFWFCFCFFV